MDLHTYQPLARRTMKELPTFRAHAEHMTLGINGELGEIADAIKKFMIYGKGVDPVTREAKKVEDGGVLDLVNLSEEGGDCWWYIVGFVPELMASYPEKIGEGLDALLAGFSDGLSRAVDSKGPVTLITQAQAQVAAATLSLLQDHPPTHMFALQSLQVLGRSMGVYYGHFGLDLSASLDANIAKLAKRYGDKYSDLAALNRDLAGERAVLEANTKVAS